MSRLEELLQELCPNGVEYKSINDVCNTITDYTAAGSFADIAKNVKYINNRVGFAQLIRTTDLKSQFENPDKFVYVDEHAFNYLWRVNLNDEGLILPNVGNCGEVYYVTPDILLHDHNVLGPNAIWVRSDIVDNRFLYHLFLASEFQMKLTKIISPTGQTKFNKTNFRALKIPVPPLEVQREIVRILDSFTLLTAELTAELTARKKQYEYYRDDLLEFRAETPQVRLGDICSLITKGTTPKSYTTSGVAFVKTEAFEDSRIIPERLSYVDNETHTTFLKRSILEEDDILISIAGTIGKCAMVPKDILPANTNQALAIIRLADGNSPKYVMYVLQSDIMKRYMAKSIKGSAQPNLNLQQLNDFIFPLPSFDVQMRLVHLLDNFEKICNDITTGLPAEIEARQKQYEFYRDKLLSFKQL